MDHMRCEYEPRVARAVRENAWDESLARHVENCAACREVRLAAAWVCDRAPSPALTPPDLDDARQIWQLAHALPQTNPASVRLALVLVAIRWAAVSLLVVAAVLVFGAEVLAEAVVPLASMWDRMSTALTAHVFVLALVLAAVALLSGRLAYSRR